MKKLVLIMMLLLGAVNTLQAQDIDNLRKRAYSGDPDAMYELSEYYRDKDQELSDSWRKKAIENGSKKAFRRQQDLEREAWKAEQNAEWEQLKKKDGVEYFRRIYLDAECNHPDAMLRLGRLYDDGDGAVTKNTDEALSWYRRALDVCDKQLGGSRTWFFEMVDVSCKAGRIIYEELADKGNEKAIMCLADYYFSIGKNRNDEGSLGLAKKYYNNAAKTGNTDAQKKINEITTFIKEKRKQERAEEESQRIENDLYYSTMRNFAGFWTCPRNRMQYKFDSNGNGWVRFGNGRVWETLGVRYISYNKIKVYDASAWVTLEIKINGEMVLNGTWVYRKR